MAATFTKDQQTYLDNLRSGTQSTLIKLPGLVKDLQDDFDRFETFFKDKSGRNSQSEDLYLTVKRQDVLDLLQYADTNQCLVLQNCFGFDQPIDKGGRVQLIQKGNVWERPGADDATVFHSVFKKMKPVGPNATQKGYYELFLNMNPAGHIAVDKARQYLQNFRAYYPGRTRDPRRNPFTLGYLLPVKALLTELANATTPFGSADELTFRWGLTSYGPFVLMGDFSLVIGIGDTTAGPVIVFRSSITGATGANRLPPCPPNPGCNL